MSTVTSRDGTTIGYDRTGEGPALILVDGALCYRAFGPSRPLARRLAGNFTVITYDRRGRGESGDTPPYSVEREVEDIAALVERAGGSAYVYGISSGAALALEAANRIPAIKKLAVYEPPFVVDDEGRPVSADFLARLLELVAADQRGQAVKLFMRHVGSPAVLPTVMQVLPMWRKLKAVAHTLPYDFAVLGDTGSGKPLPASRWSSVTVPTLVMDGGKSPAWMRHGVAQLAELLTSAEYRTLPGQTHMLKPQAVAPVLVDFFGSHDRQVVRTVPEASAA